MTTTRGNVETLRKELHEVRHVIEEYNRRERLVRLQPPLKSACGIVLKPGFNGWLHVRVKTESASGIAYTIDRWD